MEANRGSETPPPGLLCSGPGQGVGWIRTGRIGLEVQGDGVRTDSGLTVEFHHWIKHTHLFDLPTGYLFPFPASRILTQIVPDFTTPLFPISNQV